MTAMSDYLENKVVDHVLGTTSFTSPSTVYVALYTSDPTDANSGTEVSGGSYARVSATFGASSSGSATNDAAITFAAPTANWGTISHFGIFDALSSGNLLVHGSLSSSIVVNNGDSAPSFPIGALTVTGA